MNDLQEVYGKELPNKFDEEPAKQPLNQTQKSKGEAKREHNYLVKPNLRLLKRDIDSSSDFSD